MSVKVHTNSASPIFFYLADLAQESILGRHLAYFLAGWVLLFRFDCRAPKSRRNGGWLEFLSLAGARYWPLVLAGFVFFTIALLLLLAQAVGFAQPALIAASNLNPMVVWVLFFLALSAWRYAKGKEYLMYFSKLNGVS